MTSTTSALINELSKVTKTVAFIKLEDLIDMFPELVETSFWGELLDWMDVSSGDAAYTLVKMKDFCYSLEDFMLNSIEDNREEYESLWGRGVIQFLDSPRAPLPTLAIFSSSDLYVDLEN